MIQIPARSNRNSDHHKAITLIKQRRTKLYFASGIRAPSRSHTELKRRSRGGECCKKPTEPERYHELTQQESTAFSRRYACFDGVRFWKLSIERSLEILTPNSNNQRAHV